MGVVLDRKTVNVLTLPDDKTEKLFLDSIIEGFGLRLRVERDGRLAKGFFVQYRHDGRQRRQKIKATDVDKARQIATKMLNKVADDTDPAAEKELKRAALTFSKAVAQYLTLKRLGVRDRR